MPNCPLARGIRLISALSLNLVTRLPLSGTVRIRWQTAQEGLDQLGELSVPDARIAASRVTMSGLVQFPAEYEMPPPRVNRWVGVLGPLVVAELSPRRHRCV